MDSDVEKVKARLNIAEVVGQYVPLKKAGRNLTARCPFHKERTPSFMVSPERGTYICFGCGEKGDVFSFIQKIEGVDFPTALKELAEKAGVTLTNRIPQAPGKKEKEERLREVVEAAVTFYEGELKKRKDVKGYITARGVHEESVASWRLGYAPAEWDVLSKHLVSTGFAKDDIVDAGFCIKSEKRAGELFDRFRGRVIFPLFDVSGQPIAVSGRFYEKVPGAKGDEPAKYVNSPETAIFKKSRTLYGLDRARTYIRKLDCILLVEGQFDLILSHQSGLPFAVALSGTALTPEHLSLLSRFSKRLVLALDADEAGIRAGLKSALMATLVGFDVKIPTFPQGKDPADLGRENPELLKAAVRTSETAVEFFLNVLWPTARDERSYKKVVEVQVLPLVAAIESEIEREHFVKIVASRLSVSEGAVRSEVAKLKTPREPEVLPEIKREEPLPPFKRAVGMLLFYFDVSEAPHARLKELLGDKRLKELTEELAPHAESLRFRFEREVSELSEEVVAGDLFKQIESILIDEEMLMARGDAKKLNELVRRKHNLSK